MTIRPWTSQDKQTIHSDRWVNLSAERVTTPGGAVLEPYYTLSYPDWAVAFAMTPDDRVVMLRQYRHGAGIVDLELPGGCVDPGDVSPVDAARRELREETGYDGNNAVYLGRFAANPAIQNNYLHVTLIRDAVPVGKPAPEPGEELTIETMTLEAVREAALTGGMANAMHIAAVFFALNALGRLSS